MAPVDMRENNQQEIISTLAINSWTIVSNLKCWIVGKLLQSMQTNGEGNIVLSDLSHGRGVDY